MIYTIAIGETIVTGVTSLSRVETLDESFDYASLVLSKESSADSKKMKEVVTITVQADDSSELRSYYYLIDSDIVTPIDKDDNTLYRHEISLIELTSRLSDYTVGYRQFSNMDDDLFTVLSDLVNTVFFRNSFIDDSTRRVDIDLTHSSLQKLVGVPSRSFEFNNHTLMEAIVMIMNEVGGFPRVIFQSGVYKLTLDLKNERQTIRTILANGENNYKQTHNITKYGTVMESYVANQLFDSTVAGASTYEPSSAGFMPLISETLPFNSDSAVARLRYNIRQIEKVEFLILNDDATTFTVDATARVVHEDVYETLPVGDSTNEIIGSITLATAPLTNGAVTQKIGTLYYKDNKIENFFTQFGSVWSFENWSFLVDTFYYDEGYTEAELTNKWAAETARDYKNIRIRVKYIPLFDDLLHAERYNTDDIDRFTMIQSNQNAGTVSTEQALKSMGTEINALGNKEILTTYRLEHLYQEYDIGDYTSDNYVLSKKEIVYHKDHLIARYEWDKNYQKRNENIAVRSDLRMFAIPSGGISDRKLIYKEYVYVGDASLTSEITVMSARAKEIITNIFEGNSTTQASYNQSIQNAIVTNEDVLTLSNPLLLPVISVGGRNALNFKFGFQSPTIAGERLDTVSQSIPLLDPIPYTDEVGELEFINWELIDYATVSDPTTLPKTAYSNVNNPLIGTINNQYLVKKDSKETLDFSYQIHFIPSDNIVLGDYLIAHNNLIETKDTFETLKVYSSDEFYTQNETAKPKGTEVTRTITKVSSELITISSNVNNAAWAIATASGELVIAVNQFSALQTEIPFKYFNSRHDIDYTFLGVGLYTPPASPTGLAITTIDAGVLQLDWTDNSTNETNFLIQISEDGSTYNFLDTVLSNVETYTADGLMASTQYYFRVWAYNQAGLSSTYTQANGTTGAEPNPPLPVTNLNVTAVTGGTRLNASWSPSANATSYDVKIKLNSLPDVPTNWDEYSTTNTTYQFTGLTPTTWYDVWVRARNADGASGWSTYLAATSSASLPTTATPSITIVDIGHDFVEYSVQNVDDDTVTLLVDYALGNVGDQTPDRTTYTNVASGSSRGDFYALAEADTNYTITATAQASGEEESDVASATFTTLPTPTPPSAPSTFVVTDSTGGITFSWSNVTDETGYTIEIHTNSSFTALLTSINKSANVVSHTESPLITGTYWARIRAYNANGNSAWKNCTDNPIEVT